MIPAKRWCSWIAVTLLGSCLPLGAQAAEAKAAPTDTAALRALEQRVRAAARKVMPAVVAVEAALKGKGPSPKPYEPFGSGVIICADGLVLSQYHVSHALDLADYQKGRKPGEHLQVILHDGRRCEAELLGADRTQDLSLLRLLAPGPYPCTPLAAKTTVQIGDGVLKLGHPLGYRPGRPVVRFGRVLYVDHDTFVADCPAAGTEELRSLFDGSKCYVRNESLRRMTLAPDPSWYNAPTMYLAGLGLRPLDPRPARAAMRKSQEQFWFPDNFALYEKCRVLPNEDIVDGAACVVVEAERHDEWDGKRHTVADRMWFDPQLGFAPRRWERRVDGLLADLRKNEQFDEFAPGCWLPWASTWARGTPAWVAPELRDRIAYSYHRRLRKARVNNVGDDVFKP